MLSSYRDIIFDNTGFVRVTGLMCGCAYSEMTVKANVYRRIRTPPAFIG